MRFLPEPAYRHGSAGRTAIVLVNLGTPDAPTAAALRPYLRQFLSDRRVVEIPRAVWWFILNLFILPLRPARSARKYASIWTSEGSPLLAHTLAQAQGLAQLLAGRGHDVEVVAAMRYGSPSLPGVLTQLRQQGCMRILVLPSYPQYSGTPTASVWDEVFDYFRRVRNIPELRLVRNYHDHAAYISALAARVREHWQQHGRGEKLVMSFHGVPRRTLDLGDPYHCECQKTARLLASELGLAEGQYLVTFQSRFGKAEWLQPYTASTVQSLAREGVKRLDVVCPGFTADCLETLEEINIEVRADFMTAGGESYHYIPCLNTSPAWLEGLAGLCEEHLQGWPTQAGRADESGLQRDRARALGAAD